uniref:GPI-anchored wall transfer protein 1 n=1 Tax=Hyaloperonospora arabidopsidis (strain Emoy2) TaxID=559515 RepID=M4BD66_HYAAE
MDEDYKLAKEAFVAGLEGTSAREVFLVFAIAPGSLWLYSELLLLLEVVGIRPLEANDKLPLVVQILLEFVVTVVPTMVGFTFTEYTVPMLVMVYCFAAMLCILSWYHAKEYIHKHCRKEKMNQLLEKELPFLTNFRAQIMLSTCFAILAVDFTIFPRRFAKTENYGFSVMDIGVGAFIISSAIVSAPARQVRPSVVTKRSQSGHTSSHGFVKRCYDFLRPIALVLVFGIARFLTVKGVNYQEHVSEYGVHWNFYFTLAGVYLVYSFLRALGKWATSPVVAISIVLGYQVYLSQYGGEEYILHAPRGDDLMSQNREGILSLAGYASLYMLSVNAGQCIFANIDANGSKAQRNMRWLVITLFAVTVMLWLSTYLSVRLVTRPSRRMLNMSYLLWVLAESASLLAVYCVVQTVCTATSALSCNVAM